MNETFIPLAAAVVDMLNWELAFDQVVKDNLRRGEFLLSYSEREHFADLQLEKIADYRKVNPTLLRDTYTKVLEDLGLAMPLLQEPEPKPEPKPEPEQLIIEATQLVLEHDAKNLYPKVFLLGEAESPERDAYIHEVAEWNGVTSEALKERLAKVYGALFNSGS